MNTPWRHYLVAALVATAVIFMVAPRLSTNLDFSLLDVGEYHLRAVGLATGHGYQKIESPHPDMVTGSPFIAHPLVPLILSIPMSFLGTDPSVAMVTHYALQFVPIIGAVILLTRIFTLLESVLLIGVLILQPLMLKLFPSIGTDVPFFFASLMMFLLFAYYSDTASRRTSLLLGLGFGLLVWVRYPGVSWGITAILYLVIIGLVQHKRVPWEKLGMFVLGWIMPILVLVIWIASADPSFQSYFTHHGGSTGRNWFTFLFYSLPRKILRRVGGYAPFFWDILIPRTLRFGSLFSTILVIFNSALFLVFFSIGVWTERKNSLIWKSLFFAGLVSMPYFVTVLTPTFQRSRYLLPVAILLLIPAVYGARYVWEWAIDRFDIFPTPSSTVLSVLFLGLFLASNVTAGISKTMQCYERGSDALVDPEFVELRLTFQRLRGRYGDDALLVSQYSYFQGASYTGLKIISKYDLMEDRLPLIFADNRYRRLILIHFQSRLIIPQLEEMITGLKPELRHVMTVGSTIVYEVDIQAVKAWYANKKSAPTDPTEAMPDSLEGASEPLAVAG